MIRKGRRDGGSVGWQSAQPSLYRFTSLLSPVKVANICFLLLEVSKWKCKALLLVITITKSVPHHVEAEDGIASILFSFFSPLLFKHLFLNSSGGNGNVAKLYLKQQAKNKSDVLAAQGDLGRSIDKTNSYAWLWVCVGIKCKMENIVPTVKVLQSTSLRNKKPACQLTARSCTIVWTMIFVHD